MNFKQLLKKLQFGKSAVGLYGNFGFRVYDNASGVDKLVLRVCKKNQITNQGREGLLELMNNLDSDYTIDSFSVGTDATPPTILDTDATMGPTIVWSSSLTAGVERVVVATPPNSFYVSITKTLTTGDANGYTLTEAGIFMAAGGLYARQIHSPIEKTNTMTIQYDWQLGLTIQS